MTTKSKDFTREDAIQAAEHLIDTYPMLSTVQELFDAGRLEKLFDNHQQAMSTWGRLMSRVRPENCGEISEEDKIYFANYYIELRHNDETGFHFAAGRKNTSSNGYVLKYQEEIFRSYEEAAEYIDAIEATDKAADQAKQIL